MFSIASVILAGTVASASAFYIQPQPVRFEYQDNTYGVFAHGYPQEITDDLYQFIFDVNYFDIGLHDTSYVFVGNGTITNADDGTIMYELSEPYTGIAGIIRFSPVDLSPDDNDYILNIDLFERQRNTLTSINQTLHIPFSIHPDNHDFIPLQTKSSQYHPFDPITTFYLNHLYDTTQEQFTGIDKKITKLGVDDYRIYEHTVQNKNNIDGVLAYITEHHETITQSTNDYTLYEQRIAELEHSVIGLHADIAVLKHRIP